MAPGLNTVGKTETHGETQWALKSGLAFLGHLQTSENNCVE